MNDASLARAATRGAPLGPDGLRSPSRVEALSDGVFAIILTLLVLEIAVPSNLSGQSLREVISELRPTMAAWVISFLITGMYWVTHRDLFARIRVVNRDLVWLSLLFLLPASLIPFAASVLGEYPDEPIALHIYGVVLIAVTLMRLAMYWYVVVRPHLLHEEVTGRFRLGVAISAAPLVFYAAAMAIADTSTTAGVCIFLSVPIAYFLGLTLLRERPGTRAEAEGRLVSEGSGRLWRLPRPDLGSLRLDAVAGVPGAIASVPDGMASAALVGINPVNMPMKATP